MKIGILTYWSSSDNYGQVLQCYALQRYLINQGHDAFLIKYNPSNETIPIWRKLINNLSFQKIVYKFSSQRRKDKQNFILEQHLRDFNRKLNVKRQFDEFRHEYIHSTDIVYSSIDELRNSPPEADAYICGSDQVWNNSLLLRNAAAWYLSFGKENVKRFSYAASIGRSLQKEEMPTFRKYLAKFDAISVREDSARELCVQAGFPQTLVTLDPTLMLPIENFRRLEHCNGFQEHYMFLYVLNVSTQEEIYWKEIQAYLQTTNLDLKIVCSSGYMQARELLESHHNIQATIPEWLGYIDDAQCVMSTSFHGVVFCIKMHKPFLAIMLTNKYAKGNDRIISLLHQLDLSSRIYNPNKSIDVQMTPVIDWDKVEQKISALQKVSREFLNRL